MDVAVVLFMAHRERKTDHRNFQSGTKGDTFFPKISPATWEWTLLFFCLWKGERKKERLITVIFSLELKVILFLLKLDPGAL